MLSTSLKRQKILREVMVLGAIVVGILAARSTLADHYHVPSGSMEYTLIAGDRVFVDKRAYGFRIPFTTIELTQGARVQRGDIVIFDSPDDGTRLIKRIVAVGGDEVLIRNGHLSVNGEWLRQSSEVRGTETELIGRKTVQLNLADGGGPDIVTSIVPGQVLAIGDHRGRSKDGRYFGAVSEDDIYGRAVAIYYRRGDSRFSDLDTGFIWQRL